jgi:predicted secreted protein
MVDKVKPLVFENPASGGTQTDYLPTELDPNEDYVSTKGIALEDNDNHKIDKDTSGNIQFQDANQTIPFRLNRLVKDFGTPASSLVASVQDTTNAIKTLTLTSNTDQIFTGTTAGQIVRLPNATTLLLGHKFEIWNLSNKSITVENSGGNNLTTLNANGRTTCILVNNSTTNGVWALTYTLDNGNVFGTQIFDVVDESETSNNSTTVWVTKLTLTTPSNLPLGDYLLNFQFIWRAANASREADFRFRLNGSNIVEWQPSTGRTQDRQLLSGFRRSNGISGTNTWDFQFKVVGSGTTIFVQQARMFIWRVA